MQLKPSPMLATFLPRFSGCVRRWRRRANDFGDAKAFRLLCLREHYDEIF